MATIDVAGRTLKESHGKARVAQPKENRLVPSDFGLVPSSAHSGVAPVPRGKAQAELSPQRQRNVVAHDAVAESVRRSKKPGAAVVRSEETPKAVVKRQNPMSQSKGVEAVLSTAADHQNRPQTAPTTSRMRHLTAEQQATRKLERLAAENPQLRSRIDQELVTVRETGGEAVVDFERRIQRHLAVEEVRLRNKELAAGSERTRNRDTLGDTTKVVGPFAVGNSDAPTKDQLKVSQRRNYRPVTAMQKQEEAEKLSLSPYRLGRKVHHTNEQPSTPFDTASYSGMSYPEPPAVGVAGQSKHKHGKGHVEMVRVQGNIDEQLQRHAIARCARHKSGTTTTTTETAPPPQAPLTERRSTLLERQEQRCKEREAEASAARRGRQFAPQNYRPTALW